MYKLLIVDDEEIEREGMANLIPWESYDINLLGTAWNGAEALERIQIEKPDIIITDIKMPIMDGITLIKRTKEIFPDIEFVVLSGYGEFEYTSQVMGEGLRHYLLKPCDEEKIAQVIEKVKCEIKEKVNKLNLEKEYKSAVYRLLPRAKEQIFRNMLSGREQSFDEYQMFLNELENKEQGLFLLAFHGDKEYDYLEQFVIGNIMGELLGEQNILLSTVIRLDALLLMNSNTRDSVEQCINKTKQELAKLQINVVNVAISKEGHLNEVVDLYEQTQELLRMGTDVTDQNVLHYGLFSNRYYHGLAMIDYKRLKEAIDFPEILFEVFQAFMKMKLRNYTQSQMKEFFEWTVKVLFEEEAGSWKCDFQGDDWELVQNTVEQIAKLQRIYCSEGREEQRVKTILYEVFKNIGRQDFSLQFLSKEVLYMNEDHVGRIFTRNRKEKFSTFLLTQRIKLAQRMLEFDVEIKISQLAESVGFAPDGQYFSKVFRKETGFSPMEYKEKIRSK